MNPTEGRRPRVRAPARPSVRAGLPRAGARGPAFAPTARHRPEWRGRAWRRGRRTPSAAEKIGRPGRALLPFAWSGRRNQAGTSAARVLVLLALVYLGFLLTDQQLQLAQVGRQRAETSARIAVLREANSRLEAEVARLSTDAYVEEVAREALGLARQGEVTYTVYVRPPSNP